MVHFRNFLALSVLAVGLNSCAVGTQQVKSDAWMFQKVERSDDNNPILEPNAKPDFRCPIRRKSIQWAEKNVFNPAAVVRDDKVWLLFRGQDQSGTSRIGLAESKDGFNFQVRDEPVLFPTEDKMKTYEWEGGCEDPRVIRHPNGKYIMTYTAYDNKVARLCVASSSDLKKWEKHGLAFPEHKYSNLWSKSGAIVCEKKGDKIVAKKIKGKFWMYWGDYDIFLASSDDLISWRPLENKQEQLVRVMQPRSGYFDSRLVEPGPYALVRKEGILLLYNAANSASSGDKTLGGDVFSIGQALFSSSKPERLLVRPNQYLLSAERYFEKEGSSPNTCTLEGMVWFKDHWFLYYGAGGSRVAVAECWEKEK
jgi:predicted GH43/DUF377 family glycosyl hydrolase